MKKLFYLIISFVIVDTINMYAFLPPPRPEFTTGPSVAPQPIARVKHWILLRPTSVPMTITSTILNNGNVHYTRAYPTTFPHPQWSRPIIINVPTFNFFQNDIFRLSDENGTFFEYKPTGRVFDLDVVLNSRDRKAAIIPEVPAGVELPINYLD